MQLLPLGVPSLREETRAFSPEGIPTQTLRAESQHLGDAGEVQSHLDMGVQDGRMDQGLEDGEGRKEKEGTKKNTD